MFLFWQLSEWLEGKDTKTVLAPTKTEPLEVNVEETAFVTCFHSPRSSMEHLQRRMSHSSALGKMDSNVGSAKKVMVVPSELFIPICVVFFVLFLICFFCFFSALATSSNA